MGLAALGTAAFLALGIWQLERRVWKLALIDRVDHRVHAAPVPAPGPTQWPTITPENAEYLHVSVAGHFLPARDTMVRATTELGAGFWVIASLQTDSGFTVLINRGFISPDVTTGAHHYAFPDASQDVTVTGLLRMTEPGGGFLRKNAPAQERWYSRDVTAIAQARRLSIVAPYFIDADAGVYADRGRANPGRANPDRADPDRGRADATDAQVRAPVGGLTVVAFRNAHLSYALTWFALGAMCAAACVRVALNR